jgi:hypothetical protein
MNQFWCKQVQGAVVMGFQALAPRFFTGAVEKRVPLEAVTQLTRPFSPSRVRMPQRRKWKTRRYSLQSQEDYFRT